MPTPEKVKVSAQPTATNITGIKAIALAPDNSIVKVPIELLKGNVGQTGLQGPPGNNGTNGTNGTNGVDGSFYIVEYSHYESQVENQIYYFENRYLLLCIQDRAASPQPQQGQPQPPIVNPVTSTDYFKVLKDFYEPSISEITYDGVVSTSQYSAPISNPTSLLVNKIGAYKIGNIVRINLKKPNPFVSGQFTYSDLYFEITNILEDYITVSLLGTPTPFISGTVVEWQFNLVSTDKKGIDFLLLPYKKTIESGVYLYEPSTNTYTYVESSMGLLGGKRRVYIKKQSSLIDVEIKISVSLEENIPVYLTNITPKTISGTDSTPVRLTCSGCTFINGESVIYLHSYDAGTLNNANKLTSCTIIRQGTLIYIS